MIEIGGFRTRTCRGKDRRAFVRMATSLPVAWGLAGADVAAAASNAQAKSVMVIWLWGGPSQLDTFDPKPKAPSEYRGPFSAISTRSPGVHFSEPFPRLADRSQHFAVIRSTVFSGNHGLGTLTGSIVPMGQPNFGSIIAKHRRSDRELPAFVSIVPPRGPSHGAFLLTQNGRGGGNLGASYDPFMASCSADGNTELRGLLDQTLVLAMGEMGRTPKINATGGRDHWATCSTLWAGAGVKGGRVIGATDSIGGHPISKPIDAAMVGATILDRAGIDLATREQAKLLPGAEVIHELF